MTRFFFLCLVLAVFGCSSDGYDYESSSYSGSFECTNLDADEAWLIVERDGNASTATLGWISSDGFEHEATVPADTGDGTVFFEIRDLYYQDDGALMSMVTTLVESGDGYEGTGTISWDGTLETCTFDFR